MKIHLFLVILIISICCFSSSTAQNEDTKYVQVFALNMRSGPGMEFEKTHTIFLNSKVLILSQEEDWLEIQVDDTLRGWIAGSFVGASPITGFERDKLLFMDGNLNAKIRAVNAMTEEQEGESFEFLKNYVLNQEQNSLGLNLDKVILPEIFREWANNDIEPAVSILIYLMDHDIGGEIGQSAESVLELRVAAKEAIKVLVRK